MTLREIFAVITRCVRRIPDIRTIILNDITRLNEMRDVEYGVFGITQNQHTSTQDLMTFSLNLFYIDRLLNSGDNEVQVQSHGLEVLRQLLALVNEEVEVGDAQYTCFTQRFQDMCAGVYTTVTFALPVSDCADVYLLPPQPPVPEDGDFDNDFDNDFTN